MVPGERLSMSLHPAVWRRRRIVTAATPATPATATAIVANPAAVAVLDESAWWWDGGANRCHKQHEGIKIGGCR